MLGNLIGEEPGKITALRVLDSGGGGPKVEVNMRTNVKILGLAAANLGPTGRPSSRVVSSMARGRASSRPKRATW